MEILKKSVIAISAIILGVSGATAQTTDDIQKAFKASYVSEYKADYTSAIADLQKVYKADSYELNLRMGWLHYMSKQYTQSMDYYQKAINLKSIAQKLVLVLLNQPTKQNNIQRLTKSMRKF